MEEETEEDVIEKQKISEFVLAPEVAKSVTVSYKSFNRWYGGDYCTVHWST